MQTELRPVHEMEHDRSTSKLELSHINPTRSYALWSQGGMALYTWQNNQWFDTGNKPLREDEVPLELREKLKANPVTVSMPNAPTVTGTCKLCGDTMNQSEMETHLLEHVRTTMQAAGTVDAAPEPPKRKAS